jgi:hypothetical protein
VKLEINTNSQFPPTGDDVIAIGFGATSSGGSYPNFLQDVEVNVNSNQECSRVGNVYNQRSIGPESICASVPGGGKDAC